MHYPEAVLALGHLRKPCRVEELSPAAAGVRTEGNAQDLDGTEVVLEIPGYGRIPAEVVVMTDGSIGLMFLHDGHARDAMRVGWPETTNSGTRRRVPLQTPGPTPPTRVRREGRR